MPQTQRRTPRRGGTTTRRPASRKRAKSPSIRELLPRPRKGARLPPGMIRLDYERARGYLVRIGYVETSKGWRPRYKAYFSDSRCGGKAKARAAAEKWLKDLIRTGRPPKE